MEPKHDHVKLKLKIKHLSLTSKYIGCMCFFPLKHIKLVRMFEFFHFL